jgi:hypothetical protein
VKNLLIHCTLNIDDLEKRNKDLRKRVDEYKNDTLSDWESFKRDLNQAVDELDRSIQDIKTKTKK